MKLLRIAILGLGIAVGATPAAFAETSAPVDAAAFTRAGLTPIAAEAPRALLRADTSLKAGQCTVRFDIAVNGDVTNPELRNCTSWAFERETLRVVSALQYPAHTGGATIEDQEITFRWPGDEPQE